MRKKLFLVIAVLSILFLSGCDQKVEAAKLKVTVTQPSNGKVEVSPALPADGKVDKGSELTFTLSANTGYKVKELTINGITYSDVTDNTITKKVKIEKDTVISAAVEKEANPTPVTKYKVTITQPTNG